MVVWEMDFSRAVEGLSLSCHRESGSSKDIVDVDVICRKRLGVDFNWEDFTSQKNTSSRVHVI